MSTTPFVGCHTTSQIARLRNNRRLGPGESMFHVQATYRYTSILGDNSFIKFVVPETINRYAAFRGRGTMSRPVMAVEGFPAMNICNGH